jgi:ActR/RegA family two-component response regulator
MSDSVALQPSMLLVNDDERFCTVRSLSLRSRGFGAVAGAGIY